MAVVMLTFFSPGQLPGPPTPFPGQPESSDATRYVELFFGYNRVYQLCMADPIPASLKRPGWTPIDKDIGIFFWVTGSIIDQYVPMLGSIVGGNTSLGQTYDGTSSPAVSSEYYATS